MPMSDSSAGVNVTAISTATARDRADRAHQAEERDARDVEREQRDDDGRPGEHDGVAGGAVREADRLVHLHARCSWRRCRFRMKSE